MLSSNFYLGRKGKITNDEYPGCTVEVVDDAAGETGGYFILYFDKDGGGGDDWLKKGDIFLFILPTLVGLSIGNSALTI